MKYPGLNPAAARWKNVKHFPTTRAGTIIADPPWPFKNQATRASTSNHYKDLTLGEIQFLPVPAAAQAHLYLWTTGGHLVDGSATSVVRQWGFEPKYLMTWVKTGSIKTRFEKKKKVVHEAVNFDIKLQIGLGNWLRRNAEFVLFAVRGKAPAAVHNLPDTFFAPRGQHSSKPAILHEIAEALSPGPRLELFARRKRAGWTTWGDQLK